jgi:hypothetical protein
MINCISNKKVYFSSELAEEALIQAHIQFEFTRGSGPVAVYKCDDCGYFHLTSKGTMNEKLVAEIKNGKIGLQKEANRWMGKFKKR